MKKNPSLQLGIDGSTNLQAKDWSAKNLQDRRVKAIRDSLVKAGVPAYRISNGTFGDAKLRRDGRVEVLLKTDQLSQAQYVPTGPTGVIERWTSFRDFWFDSDKSVIHNAESAKAAEIAAFMRNNPSLQLGIDASTNPRATKRRDQDLGDRRVKAIRDLLVKAGVPVYKISDGMFGDVNLRRDRQVEILVKTDMQMQGK
jgi:hypothetical protein